MGKIVQGTGIIDWIEKINHTLNGIVWGPFMLALLIGTGIYFTIRTQCFQLKKLKLVFRHTLGSIFGAGTKKQKGAVSPLRATATALAGTMGTGNIV